MYFSGGQNSLIVSFLLGCQGSEKNDITMNGLFWNCRSTGKKGMETCVRDIMKDHNLSFLGIQETKKKEFSASYIVERSVGLGDKTV